MANAKKCDRCGRLYEFYDGERVFASGARYTKFCLCHHSTCAEHNFDLCPPCMKSLMIWIASGKGEDREGDYEAD